MNANVTQPDQPAQWLQEQLAAHKLTVLVFFRGNWCPFCQGYLRELDGEFRTKVAEAGGALIAVTSQGLNSAREAHAAWGLHYPVVSAPDNTLARRFDVAITPKAQTPLADDPDAYPEGMAQPALVALDPQGKVLFHWAIEPSEMNLGGASDRPLPMDVWPVIQAALAGERRPLEGERRLDPMFLAAHYPQAHAAYEAWVAQASAEASSGRS